MTDYRRLYVAGGHYFFTVVTEHRAPILLDHIDALREAFRFGMARHPFTIEAIVILPDHLHTVWQLPEGDSDFSTRWNVIKGRFSKGLAAREVNASKARKREKGVWQRRFWEHYLRDENDWRRHIDYVHFNPVKHGLVGQARDWAYSSYAQAVARGWYADTPLQNVDDLDYG